MGVRLSYPTAAPNLRVEAMLMAAEKTNTKTQAVPAALMDCCGLNTNASYPDNLLVFAIPPVSDRPVTKRAEESHTYVQKTINRRSAERRNPSCITQQ